MHKSCTDQFYNFAQTTVVIYSKKTMHITLYHIQQCQLKLSISSYNYFSNLRISYTFFLIISIVGGGGELKPKILRWKHQEMSIELQGSSQKFLTPLKQQILTT